MEPMGPKRDRRRHELTGIADVHRHQVARAVLEAALDAIIVIDWSGSVIEWNPAAEELFGWTRTEASGAQLAELIIPEELRDQHRAGLANYLETGEGPALNTRLTLPAQRNGGERFTVELTISQSQSREGPLFTGWLRDITELIEARDAVDRSEKRLASLVANVSDIITVVRADGTWVSSSGAGTRLLGYKVGFSPEGGIFSLLHSDDLPIAQQAFAEVVAGTRTSAQPVDLRVKGIDGTIHVLETVAENLVDDPAINGLVLTSRDVTEQRSRAAELRETSSRLTALAASLGDGLLFVNEQRRIVFTNQAFCSTFGYDQRPNDLVGLEVSQIRLHAERQVVDPEAFSAAIEQRLEHRRPEFGEEVALGDGRTLQRDYIPVEIQGEHFGHLWLYRDISAQKGLDRAQERLLDIERGLREQAEEQARALQEVANLKTELVAMVSHELRTPLTSIVSFADLLLTDGEQLSHAEQTEFIGVIDRNAKRLIRLVDDLLLLGQLESGVISIDPKDCSVAEVVDWSVESAQRRSSIAGVAIEASIEPGPPLAADPGRLGQVLDNLLSNAIKFSAAGGSIEVTARPTQQGWVFVVSDSGTGIPEEDQAQLFEPFFRAPKTAKSAPGTGLGLAICKAIVELHGGTIEVSSRVGHGTRFDFMIPNAVQKRS